jgi:hypothetical protein
MWILVWLLLSLTVLGIAVWSFMILFKQKKAWAAYAKRNGLNYEAGKLFGPPVVTGDRDGMYYSFFTGAQNSKDSRGQRLVTVLEFDMKHGMPTGAVMGTKDTSPFIDQLRLKDEFKPNFDTNIWDPSYILRTRDTYKLAGLFTAERAKAIHNIFSFKRAAALLFFDEIDCIARIEVSDPLNDVERFEKIIQRIHGNLKKFDLTPEEAQEVAIEREARAIIRKREEELARAADQAISAAASKLVETQDKKDDLLQS